MMPGGGLEPIDVENTGSNRYCCFLCDFNICNKCVEMIETVDSSNGSVMGSTLVLPTSNGAAKMSRIVEGVGGGNVGGKKVTRRTTSDSGNSVAWNDAPILKTISRDIEMKQMNGSIGNGNGTNNNNSLNSSLKNGVITQVRPQ